MLTGEAAAVGGQIMVHSEGQKNARGKAARKGSLSAVEKTAEPAVGKAALATIQERKAAYLKADHAAMNLKTWKPPPTKPKSLKGRVYAIGDDDPMNDFINLPFPFCCRREVLMVYFGNDKISECSPLLQH